MTRTRSQTVAELQARIVELERQVREYEILQQKNFSFQASLIDVVNHNLALEIQKLTEENKKLLFDNQSLNRQIQTVQEDSKKKDDTIRELTEALDVEKKKNNDLKQCWRREYIPAVSDWDSETYYSVTKESLDITDKKIATLTEENSKLKTRCDELERLWSVARTECQTRIASLTDENKRLTESNDELKKKDISSDKNIIDEMRKLIEEMQRKSVSFVEMEKKLVAKDETIRLYSDSITDYMNRLTQDYTVLKQKSDRIWQLEGELNKQREYVIEIQQLMCEMFLEQRRTE